MPSKFRRYAIGVRLTSVALGWAGCATAVLANSGHVDFTIGSVNMVGADGGARPLVRGAELRTGDKVSTGTDGRAQIRFSDGAYVSLQPNSEFDIKEYRFDGKADGTESAIFGLFKGALRTVTGLVGRVNRSKYQITTPTATIGIRGTGGIIRIGNDGSTLVTGTSGIWTLSNGGGTLQIPAGSSGFAGTNANLPPRQTTEAPVLPPAAPPPLPPAIVVLGNAPTPLFTPLRTGPGYAAGNVFDQCNDGCFTPAVSGPVDAVFDSSGKMTQFTLINTSFGGVFTSTGSQVDTGSDGILAWGRWIGDVTKDGVLFATYPPDGGLHYVVGQPTPASSLPASGVFVYHLEGATSPTAVGGTGSASSGIAPGKVAADASLVGDFTSGTVGLRLTANFTAMTYTVATTGSEITINRGTSTFANVAAVPVTATGAVCTLGCSATVNGFFAGSGATRAGITYAIHDSGTGANTTGAAAFAR